MNGNGITNCTTTNDLGEAPLDYDGCPSVQWGVA